MEVEYCPGFHGCLFSPTRDETAVGGSGTASAGASGSSAQWMRAKGVNFDIEDGGLSARTIAAQLRPTLARCHRPAQSVRSRDTI